MIREQREITTTGDWLRWRREHVTASRIGALFDAHPFLSREGLAAELRGERGEVPNSSMRDGHILEAGFPYAVMADGKPWDLVKANTYHWLPEHRLGATPDFWIGDDGLLQAKTTSPQQWEKWHGIVPLAYTLQTLTEMLVTGRSWGVLAVMTRTSGHPIHYYDVPRHEAAERRILDAVAQWWRSFDAGEFPAVMPIGAAAEMLVDDGSHVDLSADNYLCTALPERERLKAEASAAEKQIAEIDGALKTAMGAASSAWLPGFNISWRTQHRRETVIAARDIRVLRIRSVSGEDEHDAAE